MAVLPRGRLGRNRVPRLQGRRPDESFASSGYYPERPRWCTRSYWTGRGAGPGGTGGGTRAARFPRRARDPGTARPTRPARPARSARSAGVIWRGWLRLCRPELHYLYGSILPERVHSCSCGLHQRRGDDQWANAGPARGDLGVLPDSVGDQFNRGALHHRRRA